MASFSSYTEWVRTAHAASLSEGLNDPGILKAVFMSGGPGSGKSYTGAFIADIDSDEMRGVSADKMRKTFWVGAYGLRAISSDIAFTRILRGAGIDPASLSDIAERNPELWKQMTDGPETMRGRAFRLTDMQRVKLLEGRLGMLYDSTGQNYGATKRDKDDFENLGYDTMMVFVNTPLELALQRNAARSRRLPDAIVTDVWNKAFANKEQYVRLFGTQNFIEYFNYRPGELTPEQQAELRSSFTPYQTDNLAKVRSKVRAFVTTPVKNPVGQAWIADQREQVKQRRIPG